MNPLPPNAAKFTAQTVTRLDQNRPVVRYVPVTTGERLSRACRYLLWMIGLSKDAPADLPSPSKGEQAEIAWMKTNRVAMLNALSKVCSGASNSADLQLDGLPHQLHYTAGTLTLECCNSREIYQIAEISPEQLYAIAEKAANALKHG